MRSTFKSQGTGTSLFLVFSVILLSLISVFVFGVFATTDLTVYTQKFVYDVNEPITIIVEGPPFTEFYFSVYDQEEKTFPIGDPLWKLNQYGDHYFYLEGFSEEGIYKAKASTDDKSAETEFKVGQIYVEEKPPETGATIPVESIEIEKFLEEKWDDEDPPQKNEEIFTSVTEKQSFPKTMAEEDEELIQAPAKINSPVRWIKKYNNPKNDKLQIAIPDYATNVNIKKLIGGEEIDVNYIQGFQRRASNGMLYFLQEIDVTKDTENVDITYYTQGPTSSEERLNKFSKKITIESDIHYENIYASTKLGNFPKETINLYHIFNGKRISVEITRYKDYNNDGLIDEIEWIVPHTSTEVYEVEIEVLNAQSYPTVGGNWTVEFNTTGIADLTIQPTKGTTWSNENENNDLKLIQIKCGANNVEYEWRNEEIFIENYFCNETSYEISRVLTPGKHYLEFNFGGQIAHADNSADLFETGLIETNGWTTVNLKRTYVMPIVVANPREGYETSADHEVSTAIVTNITTTSFKVQMRNESTIIAGNISYIVVENGSHHLSNGILLQAGRIIGVSNYDANGEDAAAWYAVTFHESYSSVPGVIASPNNDSAQDWLSNRFDSGSLTTTGVSISLELDNNHGTAPIDSSGVGNGQTNSFGWVAMNRTNETGMECWLETSISQDAGTGDWLSVTFNNTYTKPLFFQLEEETGSTDPAKIGIQNLATTGTDLRITEERTDGEQTHGTEGAIVMVFEDDLGNLPPSVPTSIRCDGSLDCNIEVKDTTVELNASGSIDPENNNLTYYIEAGLIHNTTSSDQEVSQIGYTGEPSIPDSGYVIYHPSGGYTLITGTTQYIPIGATVDINRSFVLATNYYYHGQIDGTPSSGGNIPNSEDGTYSIYIYNSTHLRVNRGASTRDVRITWQVIEAINNEFEIIDRGTVAYTSATGDQTSSISFSKTVNATNTMIWYQGTDSNAGATTQCFDEDSWYGEVIDDNNFRLVRTNQGDAACAGDLRYVAIEWDDTKIKNIQKGVRSVGSNYFRAGEAISSIASVNESCSLLLYQIYSGDDALDALGITCRLRDDTTVACYRDSTTDISGVKYYVIEFENCGFQDTDIVDETDFGSTNWYDYNISLSQTIQTNRSVIFGTHTCDGDGESFGRTNSIFSIASSDKLNFWRSNYGQPSNAEWQVIELPFVDGKDFNDTEAERNWTTYNNVITDGNWSDFEQIKIIVNVTGYDNSGSTQNGNNAPDIQLEMYSGSGWTQIDNFSVSGTGNFSLITTNAAVLNAWLTVSNRDLRIRGVNFDYNSSSNYDQLNYSDVWIEFDGLKWTEIANHSNGSVTNWDVTPYTEQACVDLRTRSIDPNGSISYSSYYIKGSCLTISHSDYSPSQWSDNATSISSGLEYSPDKSYQFNVTWDDSETSVHTVLIEHNFTGGPTPHNDTISTSSGDVYYFDVSSLGAGNYVWREWSNNTDGYMNVTNSENYWEYTVLQNTTNPVQLSFANSTGTYYNQNITVAYEEEVTVTGSTIYNNAGTVTLFRDDVDVTSEGGVGVTLATNTNGYKYKTNVTGNSNYTSNSTGVTFYLNITKKQTQTFMWINGSRADYGLTQNEDANLTVELDGYPSKSVELWTNYSDGTWKLWDSGSSPLENITQMTSTGTFTFLGNYSGDANYTYSEESWIIIVSNLDMDSILESITPNQMDQYKNSTVTGNCSCSGGSCTSVYIEILADDQPIQTTSGGNIQVNGSNPISLGTLSDNFATRTWNITGWESGNYSIEIRCNSTDTGNTFSTENNLEVNDITYPKWTDNSTTPASGSNYNYNQNYQFNITWLENQQLDTVLLEHNLTGSSTPHNDSVTINTSGEFYFDTPSLAAGSYVYRWYANDTADNFNGTFPQLIYTINKVLVSSGSLTTSETWTITYPTEVTIGYTEINGGDDDCTYTVWRDNTDKGTGETWSPNAGSYNYELNMTGCSNYTALDNMHMKTLNVQKNSSNFCTVTSSNGWTIDYGDLTTLTCECTGDGTAILYFNDEAHNEYNATSIEFPGTSSGHDVVCNITAGINYESATDSDTLLINKADSSTSFFLNETESSKNYNRTETINLSAYSNVSFLAISIYANFSGTLELVNSSTGSVTNYTDTSPLSLTDYFVKANVTGNENYTSSQVNYTISIVDGIAPEYFDNSTNSTKAGQYIEFRLRWTDNNDLDGYIFSICNGSWNGVECVEQLGESGNISISNCDWHLLAFNKTYQSNPVVIATPVSQNQGTNDDDNPIIPLISLVNTTHMNISLCHDNGTASCACYGTAEELNYMVFDRDVISSLSWIDAGIENNVDTNGAATAITYAKTFTNAPAIFISPQTYSQGGNVGAIAWFDSYPTTTAADIIGCSHRAPDGGVSVDSCSDGSSQETFGWVAIDMTRSKILDMEYGSEAIGASTWTAFTHTKTNPRAIVTQNSEDGSQDPKYMWIRDLYGTPEFRYCEADARDYCDSHNPETLYWMAVEDGPIFYMDGWVNDSWTTFPTGGTEDWSNVTKMVNSTVGTGIAWRVYANDSYNNWKFSETFNFTTTDPIDPIASLGINPVDNYNISSSDITFQLLCSDNIAPHTLQLWADWTGSWSANQTNSSPENNTVWSVQIQGVPEGVHLWGVYCNDTSSNGVWSNSNRTLTVDQTPPSILISYYDNSTIRNSSQSLTLNISVADSLTDPQACYVYVQGQSSNQTIQYDDGWCNGSISLTDSTEGQSTINVYSNDSANNFGLNNSYIVTIDETYPIAYFGTNPVQYLNTSSQSITFDLRCIDETGLGQLELWSDWSGTWEANQTNTTPINNTVWSVQVDEIPQGVHLWGIRCSDNAGHTDWSDTNRTLTIDTEDPVVSLSSPVPNYNTSSQDIDFQFTVTDNIAATLDCDLYINGSLVDTNSSVTNDTLTTFSQTVLSEGQSHTWTINCSDPSSNNHQPATRTFNIDLTYPLTTLGTNPIDNFNTSSQSVTFDLKCSNGVGVDTLQLWSNWTGTWEANQTNATPINDTYWNVTVDVPEGIHQWGSYCNDTIGLEDWSDSNRTLTIDLTSPTISSVTNTSTTNESTLITWTTNEPANSSVIYGTDNSTLSDGSNESSLLTTGHSLLLDSLTDDTLYYYNVTSCDNVGNCQTEGPYNFTTVLNPDTDNPLASFGTNPVDNYNISSSDITFQLLCSDNIAPHTLQLWADWTGSWSANQTNSSPENNTVWSVQIQSIPEGHHIWGVWCNDTSDNEDWSDTNRTLTVDQTPPQITLPYYDNTTIRNSSQTITLNISVTDSLTTLDICLVYVEGQSSNQTLSYSNGWCNGSISLTYSAEGQSIIYIYANDSANNFGLNNSYVVTIDETYPTAYFGTNPIDNLNTSQTSITFNLYCIDETGLGQLELWSDWSGTWEANQTNTTPINNTVWSVQIDGIPQGVHLWGVKCSDNAENADWTNQNRTIRIDFTQPQMTSVTNISTTNVSTLITWITDEISNSSVIYGTDNTTLSNGSNDSATLTTTHSIQLSSLNPNTLYYYNATSCDNIGNCNTTGPHQFRTAISEDDFVPPVINLELPINNSGDNDGNVSFSYNVADDSNIYNCSLILNGELNQTNTTVQKDTTQYFTIKGLSAARYNWSIICIDDSPSKNTQTTASRNIDIIIYSEPTENVTMTDLSQVDTSNIPDFYIMIENKTGLNFNETLNLSGGVNLTEIINIQDNFIDINTVLEPRLNKSASITFYNLSYTFEPLILRNSIMCPNSICVNYYYNNTTGMLRFNVTHFTNYSSSSNSQLEIWDSGDDKGGLNTHTPGSLVTFYGNYTNFTNSESINGTDVNCTINFADESKNMTFNETSKLYWYNRTFATAGTKSWNVSCNGSVQGYEILDVTDSVTIYSMWWNSSWDFRMPITIENHSYVLEQFQVLVNINSANAPENWNWSAQDSIRFIWLNDSENVEIPHYTYYWDDSGEEALIWIRVPEISNISNETVHLYYGYEDASAISNATAVYEVYNDFESGMDYFTQRNTDGGTCSVSGGRLVCDPTIQWSGAYAYTDANFTTKYGYYIEFRMWKNQATSGNPARGIPVAYLRKPYPDLGYDTSYYYYAKSSALVVDNRVDTYSGGDEQYTSAKWNNGTVITPDIKDWTQYNDQYYDYVVVWDTDNYIWSQNVTHNGTLHSSSVSILESIITDIGDDWKLEIGTNGYYDTNAEYEYVTMRKYIEDDLILHYDEEETTGLVLIITSPSNTSYPTNNITYSGSTNNNATIKMSINGNSNHTFCSSCTAFNLTTTNNVTEGANNVTFWAINTANSSVIENETIWFYIDTITPKVDWNPEATESGTYSSVSITINCSFDETNPDTRGYQFNGTNSTSWDGNDGTNYWVVKNDLEFNTYNDIYCWINDTLGHYNETTKRNINILWIDWWDAEWTLRTPISLEEKANKYDLVNLTFELSVNTSKLYDEGKIRSDCGDIRFVYNESHKEIPYNFTTCEIGGANTTFWIMLNLSQADTILIYMYYNNSEATTIKQSLRPYDINGCTFFDSLDGSTTGAITGSEGSDFEWITDGRGSSMLHELTSSFQDAWSHTPGSEGTIEFWIKLDQEMNTSSDGNSKRLIIGGRCGVAFDAISGLTTNPGKLGFGISPQAGFYSEIFSNQDTWYENAFYHVAVTWDGTNQTIYVNGTMDKTQAQTREGGWGDLYTTLNSNWGSGKYKMSDVRLCSTARTSFPYVVYPEPNSTIQTEETVPFLDIGSPINKTYYTYQIELFGEISEYANVTWSMNGNVNQTSCFNCKTFNNITEDYVVQGLNNVTIYANSTESSRKESETIWFTVDILHINLESPLNHSGDSDGNITFYYNLSGNRPIANCSLILNGELNQTNLTDIVKDTTLNFTLNDLLIAGYNWTVNCTASNGEIVGGNISFVEVIYAFNFGGSTTDLSTVDIRNIASFTVENPSSGKIVYTPNIDLSGGTNLNSIIDISYNVSYVNSSAEQRLNTSATVSMYGLTYNETPVILRDGNICPYSICSVTSYNPTTGLFIFNVNYFSNYSSTENSRLDIWDETDPEGGSETIYVGQPIMIYANYTNVTDSETINGSGVYCNLTTDDSEYEMDYNTTTELYEYNHTFMDSGNQTYYIFCNGSVLGYEPINLTDNATIEGTSLEVDLITPPTIPGDGDANISVGYIVGANRTFVINATVICRQGYCAYVNATVRYNKSSTDPDTNIPETYTSDEAFFVQEGINTKNCSDNPLDEDEWCNITWTINVSADLNTIWKIDVMFNSSINRINTTDSTQIQVGKILLMDLSYDLIDFGILNPDGERYLYPAINSSNMTYNVTVDPNSNDIEELWIKGTHLTNGTMDYNRYINVTKVKWARAYLGDHPDIDPNLYNLSLSFDKVNKDTIPIYSGTNETMYFWIDSPGGILPLTYTGILTIMGNSSF